MAEEEYGGLTFGDPENYRGSDDKVSFRMIVLAQLQKISQNANVEFRGGYWQQKAIPLQNGTEKITEEYIPDTREIYSNSIEFLHDILYPHFNKHKCGKDMIIANYNYKGDLKVLMETYMKDGKFTDTEKLDYREKRVIICRTLFVALNTFLKDVNYLGERSV